VSEDWLRRAVRLPDAAGDGGRAMDDLAHALVPDAADWCLVDLLEPPDLVTRVVALGAAGPLPLPVERGGLHARRSSAQAVGVLSRLVDSPGRRLHLTAEDLAVAATSPDARTREQVALAESLGTTEALVLGLVGGGDVLGVLTLGRCGRGFDDDLPERLSDVAAAAGLALSGVRLRELQHSVSTALQRSLLPTLPAFPGLSLAARFVPAVQGLAVGGDWYDVFALPDRQVAVVVGDATGHDVQAAARMAELRNLLRGTAVDGQRPPAETLSRLDRVIDHLAPELSGTCVYVQVDVVERRLRWSSAGHLPPVLLRDGAAELLETPPDLMLGVRVGTERTDHERDLQPGDVLVLYTDGLVEERHTPLDTGLEKLRQAVRAVSGRDVEQVADALVRQLPSGEDDVAVLVLQLDRRCDPEEPPCPT
jgi:hypothetical protein